MESPIDSNPEKSENMSSERRRWNLLEDGWSWKEAQAPWPIQNFREDVKS